MFGRNTGGLIAIIFVALLIIAYVFPYKFWAFSAITVYPVWVQVIFWIAVLSLFFKKTRDFVYIGAEKVAEFLYVRKRKLAPYIVAGSAAIILTIAWNNHIFWGDSGACLSYAKGFPNIIQTRENKFLIDAIYKFLTLCLSFLSIRTSLAIFIIGLGAIFSIIIYKISILLFKKPIDSLTFFIAALSGSTFLVFSHIEYYPIPLLLSTLALLMILRNISENRVSIISLVPVLLATVFHPLMGYLFLSFAIIILIRKYKKEASDILLFLAIIAPVLLLLALSRTSLSEYLLIFKKPSYFLSYDHLLLFVNYIIFSAPLVYMIFFAGTKNKEKKKSYIETVMLWLGIAAAFLIFILYFDIGGFDWDVTSMILLPVNIGVAHYVVRRYEKAKSVIIAVSIIFLLSNSILGLSNKLELSRVEKVALRKNVPNLKLTKGFPDIMRIAFLAKELYATYNEDYIRDFAVKYCDKAIAEYPRDDRGYLFLAKIYLKDGNLEKSAVLLNEALSKIKSSYRTMELLSIVYQSLGEKRKAIDLLMNVPEVPESVAAALERPDNRSLGEMILLIKKAFEELGAGKAAVFKSKTGFYFTVKRGNSKTFVELVPKGGTVMLYIHSGLVVLPRSTSKLFELEDFLMRQNNILKTSAAKFYIWGNKLCVGLARPLKNLDMDEIKYYINEVSKLADVYNDFLANKFGCRIVKYKF